MSQLFSEAHLQKLRDEYGKVKGIDPEGPAYARMCKYLDALPQPILKQLSTAKIPFLSGLARNRVKPS